MDAAAAAAAAEEAALKEFKKRWIAELGRRALAARERGLKHDYQDLGYPTKEKLANTVKTTFEAWRLIGFSTPSKEMAEYITAHNTLINS
jgi:hypothetical protein